jgi:hypothetical protein
MCGVLAHDSFSCHHRNHSLLSRAMPRPTNIRQPISCEPCRKRKTRCSRTRVPCEACQRRGYSSQCTYQRPRDFTLDQPRTDSQASSPPRIHHDELVNRICSLETLLQNHIGAQSSPGSTHQNLAAPLTAPSTSCTRMTTADQSRQFPLENLPPSPDSLTCLPYNTGTLDVSENGYVRYEPRSSQWTSVLTGLSIQASLQGKAGNLQEGIESFPFTNSPIVGRRELLDILPPMPYCDRLKDIYFNVLSPVQSLCYFLL